VLSPRKIVMLVLLTLVQIAHADAVNDQTDAIRQIATRWQQAWNDHDMTALSALVAEDVDFVTVAGTRLRGRESFHEHHAARHLMQFKDSIWSTNEVDVRSLGPDILVAHVNWTMRGDRDADGTPREPRSGIFTWILTKEQHTWRIKVAHNTNVRAAATTQAPDKSPELSR